MPIFIYLSSATFCGCCQFLYNLFFESRGRILLLEHAFNINLHREDETGETEGQVRKIVFSIGVDTVVIFSCQDYCLMTWDFFFFFQVENWAKNSVLHFPSPTDSLLHGECSHQHVLSPLSMFMRTLGRLLSYWCKAIQSCGGGKDDEWRSEGRKGRRG